VSETITGRIIMSFFNIIFIILCLALGWYIGNFMISWAILGGLIAIGVVIIEQAIRSVGRTMKGGDQIAPSAANKTAPGSSVKLLDTSVIIDGRIADVAETGFIDGPLVIPRFVLNELQRIADSDDPLKRNRGRRGLDILNKLQQSKVIKVQIQDKDFPEIKEVDAKLVKLGSVLNAKVITNDFNLNKVAQFQGVKVLNLNELSNVVKPIVLPSEEMSVFVAKEGKDANQGVAYLDDGTMVVIEVGKQYIGKTINVIVTSVLQTTAGRMIFAKIKE
jgi:uncharacterized protein YacL